MDAARGNGNERHSARMTQIETDIAAVVCVPTFRRPAGLRAVLDSLAAQTFARPFAVVVIDNDARGREGMDVAQPYFAQQALRGLVAVEPDQGNCHAINAAFRTALDRYPQTPLFLMIDDDEIADPAWLAAMVECAERTGADIVGGPVRPQLPKGVSPALAEHPVFAPPYSRSGPVPMLYGSGNFLARRTVFDALGGFLLEFNFLGGGDTDFFTRARAKGLSSYWCQDALVCETVPLERTRTGWILKRSLRIGIGNHRIESRYARSGVAKMSLFAKNLTHLPLSLWRAGRLLATGSSQQALHPILVAIGRLAGAFGFETQQYRARETASLARPKP